MMGKEELKGLTREVMYLMVGEDINRIHNAIAYKAETCSVIYFQVEDAYIIEGEERYHCSCNEEICWHILKITLEADYGKFQESIGLNVKE